MAWKGDHSSSIHADIPNQPGKTNWVEKAGGLPGYIRRIAKHLVADQGFTVSHAIATAVNTVKKWARGGGGVTAATQAKAAAALASWNAKKGLSSTTSTDNVLQLASSFGGASFQKNLDEIRQGQKDKGKKKPAGKGKGGGSSEKKKDEGNKDLKKKAGQSPRSASWDESKHPRVGAGSPAGGEFAKAGSARNERGAKAQKNTKAAENYRKVQQEEDPRDFVGKLSDEDLNALTEYLYSFKTTDKKLVARRLAVAAELRKRGRDVNDHGGLGKSKAKAPAKKAPARRPAPKPKPKPKPPAKTGTKAMANEDTPAVELAKKTGKALETQAERKKAAAEGQAMPDGSFPMQDTAHIKKAIKARGRAKNASKREKVKQKIIARLKAKGREDLIPKKWKSGGQGKAAGRSKPRG